MARLKAQLLEAKAQQEERKSAEERMSAAIMGDDDEIRRGEPMVIFGHMTEGSDISSEGDHSGAANHGDTSPRSEPDAAEPAQEDELMQEADEEPKPEINYGPLSPRTEQEVLGAGMPWQGEVPTRQILPHERQYWGTTPAIATGGISPKAPPPAPRSTAAASSSSGRSAGLTLQLQMGVLLPMSISADMSGDDMDVQMGPQGQQQDTPANVFAVTSFPSGEVIDQLKLEQLEPFIEQYRTQKEMCLLTEQNIRTLLRHPQDAEQMHMTRMKYSLELEVLDDIDHTLFRIAAVRYHVYGSDDSIVSELKVFKLHRPSDNDFDSIYTNYANFAGLDPPDDEQKSRSVKRGRSVSRFKRLLAQALTTGMGKVRATMAPTQT